MSSPQTISELQKKKKHKNFGVLILLAAVVIFGMLGLWMRQANMETQVKDKPLNVFNQDVTQKNIKSIKVIPDYLFQKFEVEPKTGEKYTVTGPHLESREAKELTSGGVVIEYMKPNFDFRALPSYFISLAVITLILMQVAQSMGFTSIKAATRSGEFFKDVAGNEEAKQAMTEVVEYLKNPLAYESIGAKFPKGIIMDGPPGTGKTLLAKAVAGEAGANFLAVSGSDFSSMFVGMSGMKVKGIFARARRLAPCVLFIDEIDAIGGHRLSEGTAVAREMGSTLNSLLVQMDGFAPNSGVVVIAATNRIELLDPALLRSGRFDRQVHVQLPTHTERQEILQLHCKSVKMGVFDSSAVARACIGMSGADLANVVNQAALLAVQEGALGIETRHGIQARDRVMMGDPRLAQAKSMTGETKTLLAIHEVGHALMGMVYGQDKVSRISIIPRGRSLGQTLLDPADDVLVQHSNDLINRIRLLLGGRAAELTVGETQTTGASDDLMRASRLALDFVGRYGMSKKSLLYVDDKSSDSMRRQAEDEANRLMEQCLQDAVQTINVNRDIFNEIVERLLQKEELGEDAIREFILMNPKRPEFAGQPRPQGQEMSS